jgi:hypothetical protein
MPRRAACSRAAARGARYNNANALALRGQEGLRASLMMQAEKNININGRERRVAQRSVTTRVTTDQPPPDHQVVEKGREVYVKSRGREKYYVKGPAHLLLRRQAGAGGDEWLRHLRHRRTRRVHHRRAQGLHHRGVFLQVDQCLLRCRPAVPGDRRRLRLHRQQGHVPSRRPPATTTARRRTSSSARRWGTSNFTGNQFNRTIFEGNDTVLGPNTNTYIGVSRDTAVGSVRPDLHGHAEQRHRGHLDRRLPGHPDVQLPRRLALSNAVAVSIDNAVLSTWA